MSTRDRSAIIITTLAAMVVTGFLSAPLLHELRFRKWATPLQPQCLVHGTLVGAGVGIAIGCLLFFACIRRRRTIFRFVAALCAGIAISAVLGAITAFTAIGPAWPSEMKYGVDGDHLLIYGFMAGIMGSAVSIGLLAAFVPVKEN